MKTGIKAVIAAMMLAANAGAQNPAQLQLQQGLLKEAKVRLAETNVARTLTLLLDKRFAGEEERIRLSIVADTYMAWARVIAVERDRAQEQLNRLESNRQSAESAAKAAQQEVERVEREESKTYAVGQAYSFRGRMVQNTRVGTGGGSGRVNDAKLKAMALAGEAAKAAGAAAQARVQVDNLNRNGAWVLRTCDDYRKQADVLKLQLDAAKEPSETKPAPPVLQDDPVQIAMQKAADALAKAKQKQQQEPRPAIVDIQQAAPAKTKHGAPVIELRIPEDWKAWTGYALCALFALWLVTLPFRSRI